MARGMTAVMLAGTGLIIPTQAMAAGDVSGGHDYSWMGMMSAILLIALICSIVARRLTVPSVLTILVGFICVRAVSDLAHSNVAYQMQTNPALVGFGELGIVLLMFLIGFETSTNQIRSVGGSAFKIATTGVVVPFALGALSSPILLSNEGWSNHIWIGATFVATSVAVNSLAYKMFNLSTTHLAGLVIAAAVIDDVLGLAVLAIAKPVPGQDIPLWLQMVKLTGDWVVFCLLIYAADRYLIGRLVGWIGKTIPSSESRIIVIVALAMSAGFVAWTLSLEPIIGAFAAGVITAHSHFERFETLASFELAHPAITSDVLAYLQIALQRIRHGEIDAILGIFVAVFSPIYFAQIGLKFDPMVLLRVDLYLIALVYLILAVAGKVSAGFVPGVADGLQRKLFIGFSMVARGEVGFVFANIGLENDVINSDVFSMLVLVILLTTFIGPMGMLRSARRIPELRQAMGLS